MLKGCPCRPPLPHAGLDTLILDNNPLGGTIPADWQLPSALRYLLVENCSLTGTIPGSWRLPPRLQSLMAIGNQLSGTLPPSFSSLGNLQGLSLQDNRLTGPLPATMTFNTSFPVYGLGLSGNSFSGAAQRRAWGCGDVGWRPGTMMVLLQLPWQPLAVSVPFAHAGTVPSWPNAPLSQLELKPGNEVRARGLACEASLACCCC